MQTERINIYSCLTQKISLQYFCVSDKGNECVSQIWIEKWPLPVYICTKEGGFCFFIHWIFSQSPSNVFTGLVLMYILQNPPCFSALNPSFPYQENLGFRLRKVQLQIITFGPPDQILDYKNHQYHCLLYVLLSLPFGQDISFICGLGTKVLLLSFERCCNLECQNDAELGFLVMYLTSAIKAGKELALKVQCGYQGAKIGTQTRSVCVIQTSKAEVSVSDQQWWSINL